MMYVAKVKYYIPEDGKSEKDFLFVSGDSYSDVTKKLIGFYGEDEVEDIFISLFGPDDFIYFDEEDEDLFNMVKSKLEKKVIW